jgi:hypothetical protein
VISAEGCQRETLRASEPSAALQIVARASRALRLRLGGGRTRWAHLALTRIKTALTIGKKEFEELMNVKGIGEKSFLKLKSLVTVGDVKASAAK